MLITDNAILLENRNTLPAMIINTEKAYILEIRMIIISKVTITN